MSLNFEIFLAFLTLQSLVSARGGFTLGSSSSLVRAMSTFGGRGSLLLRDAEPTVEELQLSRRLLGLKKQMVEKKIRDLEVRIQHLAARNRPRTILIVQAREESSPCGEKPEIKLHTGRLLAHSHYSETRSKHRRPDKEEREDLEDREERRELERRQRELDRREREKQRKEQERQRRVEEKREQKRLSKIRTEVETNMHELKKIGKMLKSIKKNELEIQKGLHIRTPVARSQIVAQQPPQMQMPVQMQMAPVEQSPQLPDPNQSLVGVEPYQVPGAVEEEYNSPENGYI